MDAQSFHAAGSPTVLFVMGFGNRIDGTNERWFIDRLTDAGYRVHAVQLSTDVTDFDREYRDPVQRIHDDVQPAAVVGHSLGGLVAAFLDTSARAVYLSPWWGMYEAKVADWERWVVPRIPIQAPILPIKTHRDEIGVHIPDEDWERVPKRIAPTFITEVYRAQQARPEIGDEAVVFASLEDTIVSLREIGAAVSADRLRLFDGNHQLFSARGRGDAVEKLLDALPE